MHNQRPTVFVVDDDPAVRHAVTRLVESVGLHAEPYGAATDFLAVYSPERPGCLVLDVRMAGMSGLELQEELIERGIRIPIIIVSAHGDISMAVQAVHRGAIDFLEKPFRNQVLLDRITAALERDAQERSACARRSDLEARYGGLTAREQEVLALLVEGKPNKMVARELQLSPRTVEVHRAHIMKKMGAHSISELTRLAIALRGIT